MLISNISLVHVGNEATSVFLYMLMVSDSVLSVWFPGLFTKFRQRLLNGTPCSAMKMARELRIEKIVRQSWNVNIDPRAALREIWEKKKKQ